MNVLVDPELDEHARPVQFDAGYLPRVDTRDFDAGAGEQTPRRRRSKPSSSLPWLKNGSFW